MIATLKKFWAQYWGIAAILLGFVALMLSANAAGDLDRVGQTYRLDLTPDGCRYAKTLKLPVTDNDTCHVVARFRPFRFSGGGVLYRPDGEEVTVTTSMLLGYSVQNVELPKSESERSDTRIAYIKLAVSGVLVVLLLLTLATA